MLNSQLLVGLRLHFWSTCRFANRTRRPPQFLNKFLTSSRDTFPRNPIVSSDKPLLIHHKLTWLVISIPLKHMKVSWDDDIPNDGKFIIQPCSKAMFQSPPNQITIIFPLLLVYRPKNIPLSTITNNYKKIYPTSYSSSHHQPDVHWWFNPENWELLGYLLGFTGKDYHPNYHLLYTINHHYKPNSKLSNSSHDFPRHLKFPRLCPQCSSELGHSLRHACGCEKRKTGKSQKKCDFMWLNVI